MNPAPAEPIITVCGLGPGSADLLTRQTALHLERDETTFLRTNRHPSASAVGDAVSFDDVYEMSQSFASVYQAITDRLVDAAVKSGSVTYCVPGSPLVLERSVQHLRNRPEVDVRLLPAVSFLDEVWARLQIDPVDDGIRLVDGHRFATEVAGERGPLLVAHAHAKWVLSDIKLALSESEAMSGDPSVTVLQRLGTSAERIFEVRWSELDREVEPDHLTSLYFPRFESPVGRALAGSVELMMRLRNDCPWDRSQNHGSLRRYLVEETYEVLDVLDRIHHMTAGPSQDTVESDQPAAISSRSVDSEIVDAYVDLESELGDLWFQILFHARLASEAGQFDIGDVAQTLTDKMVRRHPHVFGDVDATLFTTVDPAATYPDSDEKRWEDMKSSEGDRRSSLDGIPRSMPALARSVKVLTRVVNAFGPPLEGSMLQMLLAQTRDTGTAEATQSVPTEWGQGPAEVSNGIGVLLLAVVELARRAGVEPENALRDVVNDLEAHVRRLELGGGDPASTFEWIVG